MTLASKVLASKNVLPILDCFLFDIKDGKCYAFGKEVTLDEGWNWNKVSCPVFAVACQAEGFDSAAEAMNAAFGANYNPWGGAATNWQ